MEEYEEEPSRRWRRLWSFQSGRLPQTDPSAAIGPHRTAAAAAAGQGKGDRGAEVRERHGTGRVNLLSGRWRIGRCKGFEDLFDVMELWISECMHLLKLPEPSLFRRVNFTIWKLYLN